MRATVVGAGPNGLAAAIELARAGVEVTVVEAQAESGGALRSGDPFGVGAVVDHGATAMPFAAASPLLSRLPLADHGLRWVHPTAPLAHPLEDGAAVLHRDLARTVEALGRDGRAWRRLHEPLARDLPRLARAVLSPLTSPRDPWMLARLGAAGALPATVLARAALQGEAGRALLAGSAAHSWLPLRSPGTAAFGLLFGAAGHAVGWPFVEGGSARLALALERLLTSLGGRVMTSTPVRDLRELDSSDVVLLDVAPRQAARLLRDRVDARSVRALERFRPAPAAARLDVLLDGPIPWRDPAVGTAGTVHVGGTLAEIADAEARVARGELPERPFVLLAQQDAFDATRRAPGHRVVYAYAHVPHAFGTSVRSRIEAQIERFAPGFRDRIVHAIETSPAQLERWDENLVGGDIVGGSNHGLQLALRPTPSLRPYRTPDPRVWLCSASTPPGGGVHGMNGWWAARAALRSRGVRPAPLPATVRGATVPGTTEGATS